MIDGLTGEPPAEDEPLVVTSFALRTLIEEAAALLQDKMEAKGIHFSMGGTDGEEVRADRDKILQVFINLLSNAIKFNREGGSIEVRIRPGEPGHLRVDVEDTGVGIRAEAKSRIFDRHYQVTDSEGHGLGLAIVREILRRHGCRIEVHSEVGRGTRMSFTLPLASASRLDQGPGDDQALDWPRHRDGRTRATEETREPEVPKAPKAPKAPKVPKVTKEPKEAIRERPEAPEPGKARKPPGQPRFRIIRRYGKR